MKVLAATTKCVLEYYDRFNQKLNKEEADQLSHAFSKDLQELLTPSLLFLKSVNKSDSRQFTSSA